MDKIIEIIKYIIIGIIQGISEIFPISSSGHLALTYTLLNVNNTDQLNLTIFLHFASTLALLFFFKNKIKIIIKDFFLFIFKKDKKYQDNFMLIIYLFISCIPIGIAGLFLKPIIESFFNSLLYISLGFLLTSLLLIILNKLSYKNNNLSYKNTILSSMLQCICIFPGVSRSGTTLLSLKLFKIKEEIAKQFTFLLLIPISLASLVLSIFDENTYYIINSENIFLYLISMIITFIVTYISLELFFYKNFKIKYFILYMFIVSILTFLLYFFF